MNREQPISTEQPARSTTDGAWGLAPLRSMDEVGTRAESGGAIDYSCEPPPPLPYSATGFAFQDLPRRKGPRPTTLRGPLHIQCNGHGDPQHLDELTTSVLSWPYVETNLPNNSSSNIIPLRLEETAAGYNFAAFISPREFARVLIDAPTIYLALPLVCAHWAIVRGWAEPHHLCSHGLMPPGALIIYTPRNQQELSICYSLFLAAYTAASKSSNRVGEVLPASSKQ
jgi:hypothetical protein